MDEKIYCPGCSSEFPYHSAACPVLKMQQDRDALKIEKINGHLPNCPAARDHNASCTAACSLARKREKAACPNCGGRGAHTRACLIEQANSDLDRFNRLGQKKKQTIHQFKQKQDGDTWMVSVIQASQQDEYGHFEETGSSWYSERGGRTPIQAAQSYLDDPSEDNPGVEALKKDPDDCIICVIGQQVAPSRKQWKVYLYVIEDGKVRSFP